MLKKLCLCIALSMIMQVGAAATRLYAIDSGKQPTAARIVLRLSGPFTYKKFLLKNPNRLVVDLSRASLAKHVQKPKLPFSMIKSIRAGQHRGKVRLVFDLSRATSVRAFYLKADARGQRRLVLDFAHHAARQAKPKPQPKFAIPMKTRGRDIVVVIDPGHGGKDPGATGYRGTREKNVVLQISRRVKRLLDEQYGMRAVMTRRGDYYIALRHRLRIARKAKPDMFIAIHADAFKNSRAHGASVFALSQRGATSEAARWLAERENYSELGGVDLSDKSYMLRSVLLDLSQTATIGSSLDFGGRVLRRLGRMTTLHNARVEQARFVVLKSPDIPSVLIETGFISNRREEARLRNSRYQQRLAQAIVGGIKSYFKTYPPRGTKVALKLDSL
jgi:N-acetylmuramoyl-L-alanine amidase